MKKMKCPECGHEMEPMMEMQSETEGTEPAMKQKKELSSLDGLKDLIKKKAKKVK